jgi:hypothetical protein
MLKRLNDAKQQISTIIVKKKNHQIDISKKCMIGDDNDDNALLQSSICNNVRKMLGRPQFVRFGK